ncbi:MAG: hypothetical protein V1926_02890 [Candidatus Peregrinibacteria bacterium]
METIISVTLSFDGKKKQWCAWVPDIAAYGVGKSPPAALADLKSALSLYVESVGRKRFLKELSPPVQSLSLPLRDLVEAA